MQQLKPVKLHRLLVSQTMWTDSLWDEAMAYLLDNTATPDALEMVALLDSPAVVSPHKIDHLRRFRDYPPTLLLGAFDLMRQRKRI